MEKDLVKDSDRFAELAKQLYTYKYLCGVTDSMILAELAKQLKYDDVGNKQKAEKQSEIVYGILSNKI